MLTILRLGSRGGFLSASNMRAWLIVPSELVWMAQDDGHSGACANAGEIRVKVDVFSLPSSSSSSRHLSFWPQAATTVHDAADLGSAAAGIGGIAAVETGRWAGKVGCGFIVFLRLLARFSCSRCRRYVMTRFQEEFYSKYWSSSTFSQQFSSFLSCLRRA